jgi:beta-N-acetylhexosaminidase
MSTEEKVGALLMLHTAGTNAANLDQFVQHYHLGGIILMGDNIPGSVANLATLTASLKQTNPDYPPLIAIDEEGCTVKRLPWDTFPCPPQLGTQAVSATQAAFAQRGQLLQQAGITVDFGVVADVTANANSFIYPRVFGGDPRQVADRVAAAVRGLQPFTVATLKHFPGHGETEDNSHTVVPVTTVSKATWEQQDKPPFAAGIAAGSQMVMVGQLAYSAIDTQPATLSATWHRILRQELGFNGVIVTDAMGMLQNSGEAQYQDPVQNTIAAINAGNDLILFVSNYDIQANPGNKVNLDHLISGLVSAVNSGQLPEAVIDQALTRTLKLRAEVGGR